MRRQLLAAAAAAVVLYGCSTAVPDQLQHSDTPARPATAAPVTALTLPTVTPEPAPTPSATVDAGMSARAPSDQQVWLLDVPSPLTATSSGFTAAGPDTTTVAVALTSASSNTAFGDVHLHVQAVLLDGTAGPAADVTVGSVPPVTETLVTVDLPAAARTIHHVQLSASATPVRPSALPPAPTAAAAVPDGGPLDVSVTTPDGTTPPTTLHVGVFRSDGTLRHTSTHQVDVPPGGGTVALPVPVGETDRAVVSPRPDQEQL